MSVFRHKVLTALLAMSFTTMVLMYSNTRLIMTIRYARLVADWDQKEILRNIKQLAINKASANFTNVSKVDFNNKVTKDSRKQIKAVYSLDSFNVNTEDTEGNSRDVLNETAATVHGDKTRKQEIRIVLYHIYHTMLKWAAKKLDMTKCYHSTNCKIIHQGNCSSSAIKAEAVVFQGNNLPRDRPTRFDKDQAFVFLNLEPPQYLQQVKLGNPYFKDFFNWTMTYRQDSDIPYLYGSVLPRSYDRSEYLSQAEQTSGTYDIKSYHEKYKRTDRQKVDGEKNYSSIFRLKEKSSVWFVSHCGTASKRETYVSQMKKFTDIDIFGRCSNKTNECPKRNQHCDKNVTDKYKFFLAFENSVCEDYITEKVFKWFNEDIVVVVRGARYYKRYLPDGTYIDADDFKSSEDLAKFLTQLGSNEEEYLKYLRRKDEYIVISGEEHVQLAYCNLCYKLNNLQRYRKPAKLLDDWWITGKCTKPNDLVQEN